MTNPATLGEKICLLAEEYESEAKIFIFGMFVGYVLMLATSYFGMQRYSDAVIECVKERGPNK